MSDFEKLGTFYLGRPYDLENKAAKPGLLLYDSKDLVTHAVCRLDWQREKPQKLIRPFIQHLDDEMKNSNFSTHHLQSAYAHSRTDC